MLSILLIATKCSVGATRADARLLPARRARRVLLEDRMHLAPRVIVVLSVGVLPNLAQAQHEHEGMPSQMGTMPAAGMASTSTKALLGIPATREGSGTAWLPDSSPMWAIHGAVGEWRLMFHENVFVGFDSQGGTRGDTKVFSTNWFMGMARHDLGPGEILARVMLSLEPLTVGGAGYPLLLQTGETWNGAPLHDHQHPHDLFSEVALQYWTAVSSDLGALVYAALVGEPALGPVSYPHRTSARSDPLAVIGHHWQDSTHISFGVLTAGMFGYRWKVDGSWFNAREPNENRYNFDLRVPDSYSGRITVNPAADWSMQASYGYLKSPEESRPEESVQRVTASVSWNRAVFDEGNWATTAIFGVNIPKNGTATSAWLLESNVDITRHHTLFQRFEIATKSGEELVLDPTLFERHFTVGALAAGYLFRFDPLAGFVFGLGARGAVNLVGVDLEPYYGSRAPVGGVLFAQVRPADMPVMRMSSD
jgi:hypothetical protein